MLDTSVAVKWYLPEELHEEAVGLLRLAEAGDIELLAPGTVQPEFFNAHPVALYALEDLMPRAAEISLQTGGIIYDALFLAFSEDSETVVITADNKLLKALENTAHTRLARLLSNVADLIPNTD